MDKVPNINTRREKSTRQKSLELAKEIKVNLKIEIIH